MTAKDRILELRPGFAKPSAAVELEQVIAIAGDDTILDMQVGRLPQPSTLPLRWLVFTDQHFSVEDSSPIRITWDQLDDIRVTTVRTRETGTQVQLDLMKAGERALTVFVKPDVMPAIVEVLGRCAPRLQIDYVAHERVNWWERVAWPKLGRLRYCGGAAAVTIAGKNLLLVSRGSKLSAGSGGKWPGISIPFTGITEIEVSTAERIQQEITAGRLVAVGIFALLAPKRQVVTPFVIHMANGEHILFVAPLRRTELEGKLGPVINEMNAALPPLIRPTQWYLAPPVADTQPDVQPHEGALIDQLERLSTLHEAGHLSDDEFRLAKDALLRG